MFALLVDPASVSADEVRQFRVNGKDREDLMVQWLSEINFVHLTESFVFRHFEVKELDQKHLSAEGWGEHFSPNRHEILTEIKAVTYHDLIVKKRNDDTWYARIIFDL